MKFRFILILTFLFISSTETLAKSKSGETKRGTLKDLQMNNKKSEEENLKTAAQAEILISRTEQKAIHQLDALLKKYRGTSQEPDLLFRLAELYARRAKTGRFVDLYRGEKTLAEVLSPDIKDKGAKAYLGQAVSSYQLIQKKYPKYPAMDEVLFNLAFAHQQRGEIESAQKSFLTIIEKFPRSKMLAETHMALGELFFQKQNYTESQKHYDKVQDWPKAPIAPVALYKSAWCSYNLKNTPDAITKLEKILSDSKERPQASHVRSEARRDLSLFFSEVGEAKHATSYFSKHLLEEEIGNSVMELSAIYERHGKLDDMDYVLADFLDSYPKDLTAGKIYLKRIEHLNAQSKYKPVIEVLKGASKLCKDEKWIKKTTDTEKFCLDTYPTQINDLVTEWWEKWNKKNRDPELTPHLAFVFEEYLKFEQATNWRVGIHMSYADFVFYKKNYKESYLQYDAVSRVEKLEPKLLHDSLYGAIVSLDRQIQDSPREKSLRENLQLALNNYLTRCPKGEFVDEASFKKAFLFYEDKDYIQSLEWVNKVKPLSDAMKDKKEDLLLEIHRSKKDYESIVSACTLILKTSTGERAKKIKLVYQSAQQSVIQHYIDKEKLDIAAEKARAFYLEHRPEEKALEALHLTIELREKLKLYRLAAEDSEIFAKERQAQSKIKEADELSHHAVQLFLQLGDLPRSQKSLELAIEITKDNEKKKEDLELLGEISSWYGQVETTEKTWATLEGYLSKNEKQELVMRRLKFFETQSPEKAKAMIETFIQKGVEPYYSDSLMAQTEKACDEKKWQQCYQMSLKMGKDNFPSKYRARAKYLQSKVLTQEYYQQSSKASGDRLAMVMSYKAEKFDKAIQVLNNISQKSESVQLRILAVQDLIGIYNDYVTQLQKSTSNLNLGNPEMVSLKEQIDQILPVLNQRPQELQVGLAELEKVAAENKESEPVITMGKSPFPELNGNELRIFVPTFEENSIRRPLNETIVNSQSCNLNQFTKLNSLSSLGKEANACLFKKKEKELETLALRLSDLFPESPWGPYYLSILASQQKSMERSLWYLKLGEKRGKDTLLKYEELRQQYLQKPDSTYFAEVRKLDPSGGLHEESLFLGVLNNFKQKQCENALSGKSELRSKYWQSQPIDKLFLSYCPKAPERQISSTGAASKKGEVAPEKEPKALSEQKKEAPKK